MLLPGKETTSTKTHSFFFSLESVSVVSYKYQYYQHCTENVCHHPFSSNLYLFYFSPLEQFLYMNFAFFSQESMITILRAESRATYSTPIFVQSCIVHALNIPLRKYNLLYSLQAVSILFNRTLKTYYTCSILTMKDKDQTGLLGHKDLILLGSNNVKFTHLLITCI